MSSDGIEKSPLVVIDDDPTGTQTVTDALVSTDFEPVNLCALLDREFRSLHLLTNARALDARGAYEITAAAVEGALGALPDSRIVLRGDSTLRGHLLEEYLALRDVAHDGRDLPLLLVPALPAAGRITLGGVHYLSSAGIRTPLHETGYATDPAFAYSKSRVIEWAAERSVSFFPASRGVHIAREELHSEGASSICRAVTNLQASSPAVIGVDAIDGVDLDLIAEGIRACDQAGLSLAVRCSPALVGCLAGNAAVGFVRPEQVARGVLVLCGSYVPLSSRQLAELEHTFPGTVTYADIEKLAAEPAVAEVELQRLGELIPIALDEHGLAAIATPRVFRAGISTQGARERVARRLASLASLIQRPDAVVAKGGITAAVTLREGFAAAGARVMGPLVPGVALWRTMGGRAPGTDYAVVPGNVGEESLLVEVVETLRGTSADAGPD